MSLDPETLRLVGALGDPRQRREAASQLAIHFGADALLMLVEDQEIGALLPVPGMGQTLPGGPAWRAFLTRCRTPGVHRGDLPYPDASGPALPALACAGEGAAMLFLGGTHGEARTEAVCALLGLLGNAFRAEQIMAHTAGALEVAREDARRSTSLAHALDLARSDLERQAVSLEEARVRAEDAIRAKDEFLAMLGHELRNPLAPIVTALQIMRLQGPSGREQEVLERQVTAVTRLVDDLLDVSRFAQGKVELRRTRVELAVVVAMAVETASPLLEQKHHELVVDIAPTGLALDADPDRLAQVFSNLLTNAAKYSDPRGRIRISASRVGDRVVARVVDSGCGIEPDLLEAVFDRFVQQRQSIERSQGGLGLGLAIVKSLVALHAGTVRAFSEGPGTGCEFVVDLPYASGDRAAAPPTAGPVEAEARRLRGGPRLLLVDDNEDAAELLGEALATLGFDVRVAFDGPSALEVALDFQPELALLDIGLPVMDGYELGRRLRELRAPGTVRLLALTGYGQASDEVRSRDAGFDAHLVKPIDLRKLHRLLESLAPAADTPLAE